ncbi:MAG: hypothetical protein OXI46_05640 [Gemmatimonadota bacterium]|nr:hypothetical protein [Gemmatimonadota bacterium]
MKPVKRAKLEARLADLRTADAVRLLMVADDVGLLDIAMTHPQLRKALVALKRGLPTRPSRSAQIGRQLQDADAGPRHRKDDTRAKILMGGFLVAQTAHKPALRPRLVPGLAAYLARGGTRVSERNWQLMLPIYQAWGAGEPTPVGQLRWRAEAHVRIILGAFAIHILSEDPDLRQLLLPEIDPWLVAQPARTDRENRRVLEPWLIRWSEALASAELAD